MLKNFALDATPLDEKNKVGLLKNAQPGFHCIVYRLISIPDYRLIAPLTIRITGHLHTFKSEKKTKTDSRTKRKLRKTVEHRFFLFKFSDQDLSLKRTKVTLTVVTN